MINRTKLEHILEYARQQRRFGQLCKILPGDMVEIVEIAMRKTGNYPVTPDGWVMVPKELTPEMMRAVQIRSELGGYATSNLSGAYNMFSEFWNVAVSAAPKVGDL
ncbi:hypothetical protein GJM53_RS02095 [Escherichia coli]|nr:hypothetical protein [Escherichia coli]EEQ7999248.1 hypothetical protein [Escherichia coli]EEQ8117302.1 hypothetical protein [Escherichia coli]EEQ8178903.1 hypothetical protein [Escherichia coli]